MHTLWVHLQIPRKPAFAYWQLSCLWAIWMRVQGLWLRRRHSECSVKSLPPSPWTEEPAAPESHPHTEKDGPIGEAQHRQKSGLTQSNRTKAPFGAIARLIMFLYTIIIASLTLVSLAVAHMVDLRSCVLYGDLAERRSNCDMSSLLEINIVFKPKLGL